MKIGDPAVDGVRMGPLAGAPQVTEVQKSVDRIARVAERVRQGGHNIEEAVIRRRFSAGRRNLEQTYKPAVDTWAEYDNVGEEPTLLQWGENR